ncbi:MAG: leucine-rich repeat domain-containing protein [Ruminococcus sp.]|nr:leucine-rich repeat domain-containing protein [Ruminococcus sp.]
MKIKKTGLILAVTVLTAFTACSQGNSGENVSESVFEETSVAEVDWSEIFSYRIVDSYGYVRVNRYLGDDRAVVIPDFIEGLPVKQINPAVFSDTAGDGDRYITELTLPCYYDELSENNLRYLDGLQNVYISEESKNYISADGVIYTADGSTLVMYPAGRTGEAVFAQGVTKIGDRAFSSCKIDGVTLPDTVEIIGDSAFENCKNLTAVNIPGSVVKISPYAFAGSGLESVTLNEGIRVINTGAFESTGIMELYLPDSVTSAGNYILGSEKGAVISAATPSEGVEPLEKYENLFYRSDTVLDSAVRAAKRMAEETNDYYNHKAYLTDINGDGFPEMFYCRLSKYDDTESFINLYFYDIEENKWEENLLIGESCVGYYRDRETGGYAELHSGNFSETSDYFLRAYMITDEGCRRMAESDFFYPINGYYSSNDGYVTYFEGGGDFMIYEAESLSEKEFSEFAENTVDKDRYELMGKINAYETLSRLQEEYSESKSRLVLCGEFADSPAPPKADFTMVRRDSRLHWLADGADMGGNTVTIGDRIYNEYSCCVYLNGSEVTEENFEKLSALPCITSVMITDNYDRVQQVDLTGIDRLKNLKRLRIGSWGNGNITLKNTDVLKDMDIQWLMVMGNIDNIDFIADLDRVRVLEIGDSLDKPDDYYSAVAGMDSLQYIPISVFEINVTEEQEENIKTLRPDVALCYYKVG